MATMEAVMVTTTVAVNSAQKLRLATC